MRIIFSLLLLIKLSSASINIVVSYSYGEIAANISANKIIKAFGEKYPNALINKVTTHSELKKALLIKSDTLIFYFVGHSQPNNLDTVNPLAFRMLFHLRYYNNVIDEKTKNYREMENIVFTGDLLGYFYYNKAKLKLLIFDSCHAEQIYWPKFKNTVWLFSTTFDNLSIYFKNIGNLFTDFLADNLQSFNNTDQFISKLNIEAQKTKYYTNLDKQWFENEHSFPIKAKHYGTFNF